MPDVSHFRAKLETEKEKLEEGLRGVARRNPANPSDWEAVPQETGQEPDLADAADEVEHFAENRAIVNELGPRYQEVVGALARIDAGTYGVCSVGGEKIEDARLEADPAAPTCKKHLHT